MTVESGVNYLIDSMPRCGSTSLAGLLSCHRSLSCLVEPFHPWRYGGMYHQQVVGGSRSLADVMKLIGLRWCGVKHVWKEQPEHWPFRRDTAHNDEILFCATSVIALERKNLLQRYVSHVVSDKLQYWIGSKGEFLRRLSKATFPEFEAAHVSQVLAEAKIAQDQRRLILSLHPRVLHVSYEWLYPETYDEHAFLERINSIISWLGVLPLDTPILAEEQWLRWGNPEEAKWHSAETYSRIPGIRELNEAVGCDDTGWLL